MDFPFAYGRWQLPWGDILLIHRPGVRCSEPYSHALSTEKAEGVLYALGQYDAVPDKRRVFDKMTRNGLIQAR